MDAEVARKPMARYRGLMALNKSKVGRHYGPGVAKREIPGFVANSGKDASTSEMVMKARYCLVHSIAEGCWIVLACGYGNLFPPKS